MQIRLLDITGFCSALLIGNFSMEVEKYGRQAKSQSLRFK